MKVIRSYLLTEILTLDYFMDFMDGTFSTSALYSKWVKIRYLLRETQTPDYFMDGTLFTGAIMKVIKSYLLREIEALRLRRNLFEPDGNKLSPNPS